MALMKIYLMGIYMQKYICKNRFSTQNGMMIHRKQMHTEKIQICRCNEVGSRTCWYNHSELITNVDSNHKTDNLDFQKVCQNPAPP